MGPTINSLRHLATFGGDTGEQPLEKISSSRETNLVVHSPNQLRLPHPTLFLFLPLILISSKIVALEEPLHNGRVDSPGL